MFYFYQIFLNKFWDMFSFYVEHYTIKCYFIAYWVYLIIVVHQDIKLDKIKVVNFFKTSSIMSLATFFIAMSFKVKYSLKMLGLRLKAWFALVKDDISLIFSKALLKNELSFIKKLIHDFLFYLFSVQ